ncbi:hypothetical protein T484DRAFT_1771689 [Baffinella frigidus]|nr:hypothetical protein T484DRAFT_1771689 [Cryptophyta sp. CCMP2293]
MSVEEDEEGKAVGRVQQWKNFFAERGVGPEDIPKALVVHEAVGMSWFAGSWAVCYAVQPARFLASKVSAERAHQAFQAAERKLHSWSTFLDRVPGLRSANRARLVVSLAESSIIRKVALPVTVPLKLWVAWQAVTLARGTHVLPP